MDSFDGLGCYGEAACGPCSLASLTTVTAPSAGHGVVVRYDPDLIVPPSEPDSTGKAGQVVNAIRDRAEYALTQYDALGFDPFTGPVTIEVVCEIVPVVPEWANIGGFLTRQDTWALTEGASKVKLRSDVVQREFKPIVDSGFTLPDWNKPPQYWVNTVDHEMFHTIQYAMRLADPVFWADYFVSGNDTIFESGAVLAQDLIADADEKVDPDPDPDVYNGTYLEEVKSFFDNNPTIDGFSFPDLSPSRYQAPGVFQYLGERYGEGATQEAKVADYLERISEPFLNRLSALKCAIANNPLCLGDDLYGVLRDFQIAAYSLQAPNVTTSENRRYQILDRDIAHGQLDGDGQGTPYPPLVVTSRDLSAGGTVDEPLTTLEHAAARVYEISLPTGAEWVRVTVDTQPSGDGDSRLRTAVLPVTDGNVAIDPGRMPQGPLPDESPTPVYVPVTGADKLAIVLQASEQDASYSLTVDDVAGPPAVTIISPTQTSPGLAQPGTFELLVHPTLGSTTATGLSASDFTVTLDGSVITTLSEPQTDGENLRFWVAIQGTVNPGLHDLTVTFHGASASETAAVDVVVPEPGNPPSPTESPAVGVLGPVGQGQTASIDVPTTGGTGWATFQISWPGSDFDLTLHAPSGRVINESSSDPDVTVLPGTNSVAIRVAGPEAGVWQLDATGIDVPTPEPVNYDVGETDTPVLSRLAVSGGSEAGTPIAVSFAVTDTAGPLHDQVARLGDRSGGDQPYLPVVR